MAAGYYRPGKDTSLKKCSERRSNDCDSAETDGCCAVIPCTYCIEWNPDAGATQNATADFGTNGWSATIAGVTWFGYWDRNYITDECEFVVLFDGEEVYRKSCYEGQNCRDSSDNVRVNLQYFDGVLTWSKYEPRPLEHTQDDDTNCSTYFCDECECSCECMCVKITEPDTTETVGEICDTAYDCDAPLWAGYVGTFNLSVVLGRDIYGRCIITATVDGIEQDPVLFPGCADGVATITLADTTTIVLTCKKCDCEDPASCPCCPGWPETASGSISWSSEAMPSDCTDGGGSEPTGDFSCPQIGDEEGTLIRQDATFLRVRLFCDPETLAWRAQYRSATSGGGFEQPISDTWADATDLEFVCPDCADAIDGQATGQVDFITQMACETSGGIVTYDVLVHGEVTIGCP